MLTPRFSLSQDNIFLYINIRAPCCNLKELEVYVEENDFRFICSPYYLRLNLPGKINDNESSEGKFNSDEGEFVFKYPKQSKDEVFEGLDLILSLMPASRKLKRPEIEVLTSENDNSVLSPDDGNEWFIEQKLPDEETTVTITACRYGFAQQKYNILKHTEDEFVSVFDIRSADTTNTTDRKHQRHDYESLHFSSDHYIADFYDAEEIQQIIKQDFPWKKTNYCFSGEEIDVIKDFPNREYLLNDQEIKIVFYGLLDILYAYCYDRRTTNFEGTCESGWTITKLSATLSWFHTFENETEVIKSSFRRSLIYPFYRNFELCQMILKDLKQILSFGEVFIVKCLIDIYNTFHSSCEPRYILNDLYIKDYIIYMQKCHKEMLKQIIEELNKVEITEDDVELNLKVLPTLEIETDENKIIENMAKLNIIYGQDSDEDTDSSCDY